MTARSSNDGPASAAESSRSARLHRVLDQLIVAATNDPRVDAEHERAVAGLGALHPGLAAVGLGDVLDQRQPAAAAAHLLVQHALAGHEPIGDAAAVLGGDLGGPVGDAG